MKDRIKESMSSLCDGECSELELRRVLNYVGSDAEMREEWRRYNLIGSLIRDEPAGSVDLSSRIMKALDEERFGIDDHEAEAFDTPASVSIDDSPSVQSESVKSASPRALPQWMVSGAVAASVTLAILAGARIVNEQSVLDGSATLASNEQVVEIASPGLDAGDALRMSGVAMTQSSDMSAEELKQAQQVLQQYVLEHEEQAAGVSEPDPFARVANFGQSSSSAKAK